MFRSMFEPMIIDRFADRMRLLIDHLGSVAEVARSCGVSEAVVRSWRDGKSDPSRERCLKIANGSGASLLWLMCGVGPMWAKDVPDGPMMVMDDVADYRSAPPFVRERWERAKHIVALAALDISGGVSHAAFADAVAAVYWQASERPLANADLPALVALAHGLLAPATRSTS